MNNSPQSGAVGSLTDGTGVSQMTGSKVFKDFVVDLLLSASAAIAAVQIMDVGAAIEAPQTVAFAVAGATIRVVYRAILRWATAP